jgi:hypothetical protein
LRWLVLVDLVVAGTDTQQQSKLVNDYGVRRGVHVCQRISRRALRVQWRAVPWQEEGRAAGASTAGFVGLVSRALGASSHLGWFKDTKLLE